MSKGVESFVQISGNNIRNIEYRTVLPTGAEQTVYGQVTLTSDPDGNLVNPDTTQLMPLLERIVEELRVLNVAVQEMASGDLRQSIAKKGTRLITKKERR